MAKNCKLIVSKFLWHSSANVGGIEVSENFHDLISLFLVIGPIRSSESGGGRSIHCENGVEANRVWLAKQPVHEGLELLIELGILFFHESSHEGGHDVAGDTDDSVGAVVHS